MSLRTADNSSGMISRNYGGVELGYFFKRNFSLSTRNSRITTTRRERFQPPRVQLLLAPFYHPFTLFSSSSLQSGHAIPHPSPLSCGEKHLRLPLPLLDELLLIYRVPVLRLKLRIFLFFFIFFTLPSDLSSIEKIFSPFLLLV